MCCQRCIPFAQCVVSDITLTVTRQSDSSVPHTRTIDTVRMLVAIVTIERSGAAIAIHYSS